MPSVNSSAFGIPLTYCYIVILYAFHFRYSGNISTALMSSLTVS